MSDTTQPQIEIDPSSSQQSPKPLENQQPEPQPESTATEPIPTESANINVAEATDVNEHTNEQNNDDGNEVERDAEEVGKEEATNDENDQGTAANDEKEATKDECDKAANQDNETNEVDENIDENEKENNEDNIDDKAETKQEIENQVENKNENENQNGNENTIETKNENEAMSENREEEEQQDYEHDEQDNRESNGTNEVPQLGSQDANIENIETQTNTINDTVETDQQSNNENVASSDSLNSNEIEYHAMVEELDLLISEGKQEAIELRSHNFHLLKQVIDIIESNNGDLGLGIEIPIISNNIEPRSSQYSNILEEVSYLHDMYASKQQHYSNKIINLNDKVVVLDEKAEEMRDSYKEFKRKISRNAINARTGKSIPAKWILQKEQEEEEIDQLVETNRLKNIHFNIQLKKLLQKVKEKDKLADGLHLIDFEQLKIENQTLNEKIEERNDELYKLRKKVTTTVQILTHVKEKLQHLIKINNKLSKKQSSIDASLTQYRDKLTETKKQRDKLRSLNGKLKQREGFVGNDVLVKDFQQRKHRLKQIKHQIQELQNQHKSLQKTIQIASATTSQL